VSQRINTSPSPQDASSALASTQTTNVELANRKEIPLTAFDFLDGAYAATKHARTVGFGVLAVSFLVLLWTIFGGFSLSWENADVRQAIKDLEASKSGLVERFGESIGGVPAEEVLSREQNLSSAFAAATNEQGDFFTLLEGLRRLDSERARITSVVYGVAAAPDEPTDDKEETELTPKLAVRVLISGTDLAATVSLADRVRAIPSLQETTVDLGGTGASISGYVLLNRPPGTLLDRLTSLGIRPNAGVAGEGASSGDAPAEGDDS
jgi:hypothetical protein